MSSFTLVVHVKNVFGVKAGVWVDNKEVAYSNIDDVLGPSKTSTPKPTGTPQSSILETTTALQSSQISRAQPEYLIATIGVIDVVVVGSLDRKKKGQKR